MTKWFGVGLCVVGLLLPSWGTAEEVACVCPQEMLWSEGDELDPTWVYWAYRYSRDENDDYCPDDDVEPVLHYDAPNYPTLPAAYCIASDPCSQCIPLNSGRDYPPRTDCRVKQWDSGHGLNGTWDLIRTVYVEFTPARSTTPHYAKLFLLSHFKTRMILGYGFETNRPDPTQVDPTSLIKIGPNRSVPMQVYYKARVTTTVGGITRTENKALPCTTTAIRRFTLGNVQYFVRCVYDPNDRANNTCPPTVVSPIEAASADGVPAKGEAVGPKAECCAGAAKTELGGQK